MSKNCYTQNYVVPSFLRPLDKVQEPISRFNQWAYYRSIATHNSLLVLSFLVEYVDHIILAISFDMSCKMIEMLFKIEGENLYVKFL